MEIKQRGNAFGYKILLFIYNFFGYNFVAFILNFVALYYVIFAPSVKKSIMSYYKHQNIEFTYKVYFKHLKQFAISIFDRFVSQVKPQELTFCIHDKDVIDLLNKEGGVILLSHVGSWASAAHSLNSELPPMNIVMRETTKQNIQKVEKNTNNKEKTVKIIDLNQDAISANIQIANALISNELVALMVDRVVDKRKSIKVDFLDSKVFINKSPFEIAQKVKKPLVAIFVTCNSAKKYDITLEKIEGNTLEEMSQEYSKKLQNIIKEYPLQWYNFYDFFKQQESK